MDYLRKPSNPSTQSTMLILLIVRHQGNTVKIMFVLEKHRWEAGVVLSVCTTRSPHPPPRWRHPLSFRGLMIPCELDALPKAVHRQHSTPTL